MKITKEKLIELGACEPSIPWFEKNGSEDLLTTLISVNKYRPGWARWLFSWLMNRRQRVEISIFCAEKVIDIFEKKYPSDNRPRKAIEAAKNWLESPTEDNRNAAAYAASASAAAYAASASAAAAYAAASATYAAASAASAASVAATYAAARLNLQEEIIHEAVRILDRDNGDTK